ncbi:MAG: hypothetical protein F9K44_16780 [Hyphomicrobiaceae bacterium]|nr:MAG: hypothetical protein F9K44_16780 [Hyphomicrobiaceae bacterium]
MKLPFPKSKKKKFAKKRSKCKRVKSKSKRKKCLGKVKKQQKAAKNQFYVMARCSKKKWNFRADSTYDGGQAPTVATDQTTCKQKPKKKKRKKK